MKTIIVFFYKDLGLLIHCKSGIIICVSYQLAIEPKAIWYYMKKKRYFCEKNGSVTKANFFFLEMLIGASAIHWEDMKGYTDLASEGLHSIEALLLNNELVSFLLWRSCRLYETISLPTMKCHFRMKHAFIDVKRNILSRKLQTIFNHNWAKHYNIKMSTAVKIICVLIANQNMYTHLSEHSFSVFAQQQ